MIEVFESEILYMVKKSQLKNPKLRKELNHDRLISYLKVICNSSARFYMIREQLEKYIEDNDTKNIESTLSSLQGEGIRILNSVSDNRLDSAIVNEIVLKMIEADYLLKNI